MPRSLRISKILRVFFFLSCFCVVSCGTPRPRAEDRYISQDTSPHSAILPVTLPLALEAAQRVFAIYTVAESVSDEKRKTASLETQAILGEGHNRALFAMPYVPQYHAQMRSSVRVTFMEGSHKGETATRVDITKKLQERDDFYHDWRDISSNGLEEEILLDQIREETLNSQSLKEALKKPKKKKKKRGARAEKN